MEIEGTAGSRRFESRRDAFLGATKKSLRAKLDAGTMKRLVHASYCARQRRSRPVTGRKQKGRQVQKKGSGLTNSVPGPQTQGASRVSSEGSQGAWR